MADYTVSIITTSLNSEATLERTITSVIEQSYPHIDYVIVDGGSTDGTLDIIRKYEKYIAKWISEPDNGIMDALNKALNMVTGDIILLLPSDDYLEPESISSIIKAFREHPEIDVIHANFRYFNLARKEVLICKPSKQKQSDIYRNIYKWPSIYVNTFFVKKQIYEKLLPLNTTYDIAGDFEIYIKFLKNNVKFLYIDKVVVNQCSGGKSSGSMKSHIEVKNILIKYGYNKFLAYYYLFLTLFERSTEHLVMKFGLKGIRNIYAKLFYPNISIEEGKNRR